MDTKSNRVTNAAKCLPPSLADDEVFAGCFLQHAYDAMARRKTASPPLSVANNFKLGLVGKCESSSLPSPQDGNLREI